MPTSQLPFEAVPPDVSASDAPHGWNRRRLILLALAVLSPLAVLLIMAIVGEDAPIALKVSARGSIQAAREAGAGALCPETVESAEKALAAGIREMDVELRRARWNRDFSRTTALLETARRRGNLAASLARRDIDLARERARRLLARADTGFEQMEWISSFIPPRSAIRSDVSRAQVSYSEARSLYDAGQFARSAEAAQKANEVLAAASSRFGRFMNASADPAKSAEYARWVRDTVSWSARRGGPAIIVDKMRRTLTLVSNGERVRTYRAELGINGTQVKVVSGDRATPEGRYHITEKRGPRQTRWYKALLLNYPNDDDLKRFRLMKKRGQISRRAGPGNLIEIHGEGGRGEDWTDGCVALRNRDMDDLFNRVSVGTPVTIVGFEVDDAMRKVEARRSAGRRESSRADAAGGLR